MPEKYREYKKIGVGTPSEFYDKLKATYVKTSIRVPCAIRKFSDFEGACTARGIVEKTQEKNEEFFTPLIIFSEEEYDSVAP